MVGAISFGVAPIVVLVEHEGIVVCGVVSVGVVLCGVCFIWD